MLKQTFQDLMPVQIPIGLKLHPAGVDPGFSRVAPTKRLWGAHLLSGQFFLKTTSK